MQLWNVYFIGTSNLAGERIAAASAVAACRIAASMQGLASITYLRARRMM